MNFQPAVGLFCLTYDTYILWASGAIAQFKNKNQNKKKKIKS